ncbi:MAG: LytR/AlgR family response regulator transcription factor [Paludibacteraceae bacterium]
MKKIADLFYRPKYIVVWVVCITLWTFLFPILYKPTFGYRYDALWNTATTFRIAILAAIVFGVTAGSRLILYFTTRHNHLSIIEHAVWLLCELMVMCLFCDLFLCLNAHCGYFELLPGILICTALSMIFPYGILWLYFEKTDCDRQLAQSVSVIADLKTGVEQARQNAVRFADDKNNVKLVVDADRIIYIESAGNYVNIIYENAGKVVRYSLRNTMKGIEEACTANGIVRCHRSYFVNLRHVKLLKRDADSILAEIGIAGVDAVPISKTYSGDIVRQFSTMP